MKIYDVIEKPVISEKSFKEAENGKYLFWVPLSANKIQVKEAVEKIFKVDVTNVTTIVMKGKIKVLKRIKGKRKDKKKAIVTLKEGQEIKEFNK